MNCVVKFNLLLIIWIFSPTPCAKGQREGQPCLHEGKPGTCTDIMDCEEATIRLADSSYKPTYCRGKHEVDVVCCTDPPAFPTKPPAGSRCSYYREQLYKNKKCPVRPLIIGGVEAKPREFPHMALLGIRHGDGPNKTKWVCGGTLISEQFVLTAAHCFARDIDVVRLGELDYSTETDDAKAEDFNITDTIIHPSFHPLYGYNDVALIKLSRLVEFSSYIAPVCLPTAEDATAHYKRAFVAGWGVTKTLGAASPHLMKVKLDIYEDNECSESYANATFILPRGVNASAQMCAGSQTTPSPGTLAPDTCSGDSGGPLFVEHLHYSCMYSILGVTSFGNGGCGVGKTVAVYTRVYAYLDWIEAEVWGKSAPTVVFRNNKS